MKRLILIAVCVVLGLCVIGGGAYFYVSNTPKKVANPLPMPESGKITVENVAPLFYEGLPADYFVVDVRTVQEYEKKHTDGMVNIPVALFEEDGACEKIIPQLPEGKKIIFVCPFGPRAEEMFYDLTDPVEDGGCGLTPEGMFYLVAKVKYGKDGLIIR